MKSRVDYADDIFEASEKGQRHGGVTPHNDAKSGASETEKIMSLVDLHDSEQIKSLTQSGSRLVREPISIRIETAAERKRFQENALNSSNLSSQGMQDQKLTMVESEAPNFRVSSEGPHTLKKVKIKS